MFSFLLLCFSPKDAIRAVKKRLGGNKNYREVMLTLTVRKSDDCFSEREDVSNVLKFFTRSWRRV